MDVDSFRIHLKKIKATLVFFSLLLALSCDKKRPLEFELVYKANKAEAIQFTSSLERDSLRVYLKEATSPILGDFTKTTHGFLFTPVLPFRAGTAYNIRYKGQWYPFKTRISTSQAPEVLAIYPSCDTVPENLLKVYLQFSQPMQGIGSITDYVKLRKQGSDKFLEVFLPLETELWNEAHTQVTLWLDPGRVKKDLIPNKEQGNPLEKGQEYELLIDTTLESAQGVALKQTYLRSFYVHDRDTKRPRISDWSVVAPKAYTLEQLTIEFYESLDAILLGEAFQILDGTGREVAGTFKLGSHEKSIVFKPLTNWNKGFYKIKIKALLEDLAANNLNRLFDEDLQKTNTNLNQAPYYSLDFKIE